MPFTNNSRAGLQRGGECRSSPRTQHRIVPQPHRRRFTVAHCFSAIRAASSTFERPVEPFLEVLLGNSWVKIGSVDSVKVKVHTWRGTIRYGRREGTGTMGPEPPAPPCPMLTPCSTVEEESLRDKFLSSMATPAPGATHRPRPFPPASAGRTRVSASCEKTGYR